jgi:multidrug efflux pump subunit AcrA (membrane-fusion protein)
MSEITEEKSAPPSQPDRPRRLAPPPRPRSHRRGWLLPVIIVVLIAIVLGGIFVYLRYMRGSSVTYVQQAVRTGNLQDTVAATGQLQPKAVYDMNFSGAGQVQAIDVHVGQQVSAGQTLATLDKGTTMTAPANATVAAINGVVGENVGSNGNVSTGGSGSGGNGGSNSQPFMILTDTSSFTISAQVNEADIEQIKANQNAQFTLPAFPNKTFTASVTDIQTYGQTSSGVVNYIVDLAVNNSSLQGVQPYPGMTATINIITQQVTNALLVPNSALTFPSQALQAGELNRAALRSLNRSGGLSGLNGNSTNGSSSTSSQGKRGLVLELQNGQLTPVLVTTGLTDGQYTQILSGLKQGDRVVTSQIGGTGTAGILSGLGGGRGGNGGAGRGGAGGAGGGRRNGGAGTSNGG